MTHSSLLQAALAGYQVQLDQIKAKMDELRRQLDGPAPRSEATVTPPKQHGMSAAGRRRIAAAQRRRWAERRASEGSPAKARKMSAAGRKRIAEAARKRWAAFRAQKAVAK
jgi:hypothetical protein